MNKKRIWYIIPSVLIPYIALFEITTIFFSTKYSLARFIMEKVFQNNGLLVLAFLLIFCMVAVILNVVGFTLSICQKWDALSLAKTAMIVKFVQAPTYLIIFVLGVLLFITIFTIPFVFVLFIINCLTLVLTGLVTLASVINAVRGRTFTFKESVWVMILQFVFCADVVATIIFYIMLKKRCNMQKNKCESVQETPLIS